MVISEYIRKIAHISRIDLLELIAWVEHSNAKNYSKCWPFDEKFETDNEFLIDFASKIQTKIKKKT